MKMFLLILLFPLFAFSLDLSGTAWSLSGVGCMDRSLDPSSYRSKSSSSSDVSNGRFDFMAGGNLQVKYTRNRREKTMQGTYSRSGDKVDYRGPNGKEGLDMYIREDGDDNILVLVGVGDDHYDNCCPNEDIKKIVKEGLLYENWREWKKDAEGIGIGWEEYKKKGNLDIDEELTPSSQEELDELIEKCGTFVHVLNQVS